jgi:hypothetical protein
VSSREDSRPTTKASASPLIAAAAILLLIGVPLLYLLSTGPAVWLVEHGYIDRNALEHIYAPIGFCMEQSKWFQAAMAWYLSFFVRG